MKAFLELEELSHVNVVNFAELIERAYFGHPSTLLNIANGHTVHAQELRNLLLCKATGATEVLNAMPQKNFVLVEFHA